MYGSLLSIESERETYQTQASFSTKTVWTSARKYFQ